MGENGETTGETTGGGGGPNTNPIEAIGEGDGVLEVQNKERCINWFCSKLTRVRGTTPSRRDNLRPFGKPRRVHRQEISPPQHLFL